MVVGKVELGGGRTFCLVALRARGGEGEVDFCGDVEVTELPRRRGKVSLLMVRYRVQLLCPFGGVVAGEGCVPDDASHHHLPDNLISTPVLTKHLTTTTITELTTEPPPLNITTPYNPTMAILQTLLTYLTSHPHPLSTPPSTLHLTQLSPPFLSSPSAKSDSPETWLLHETLLLATLSASDDPSAHAHLTALTTRFGPETPRIQALTGIYDEATSATPSALTDILTRYTALLKSNPTLTPIEKRRITLLSSLGRTEEAIAALTKLLDASPTDAESWSHLAEMYKRVGLYDQARFCLEEIR